MLIMRSYFLQLLTFAYLSLLRCIYDCCIREHGGGKAGFRNFRYTTLLPPPTYDQMFDFENFDGFLEFLKVFGYFNF